MPDYTIVNAVAPIRVCDIGGWTDTWFSVFGAIFNIAVYPYAEVQIHCQTELCSGDQVGLTVENFGDTYSVNRQITTYTKHPLLEAAVDLMSLPEQMGIRINIYSDAPPGASTGTSAAVSVALIAALDALTVGRLTPHEVAQLAQFIETEKLGLQCGIQDQIASAYGGINFIDMHAYPKAVVSPVSVPNDIWWELERRLSVIYIGAPHSSSEIHKRVISGLGPNPEQDERLCRMRRLARKAKDAMFEGDWVTLGNVMNENTDVQRMLHPDLVCPGFEEVISIAVGYGALGCKVNGAGGDGGSITILSDGDMRRKRAMLRDLEERFTVLPIYLARQGLRVWKTSPRLDR